MVVCPFMLFTFGHFYCLSFFDLWLLITPLVSSNFSLAAIQKEGRVGWEPKIVFYSG
jgi:hypothetical protein